MTITRANGKSSTELWGVLAVTAATVATWWAWLGWDTEYQIDPVTQNASGPYAAWQVAGCVLCLVAIAVVGGLAMRPWLAPVAMTVAFTGAWSLSAGRSDDSGLWLAGAVLVFVALAWGSSLVSFGSWLCREFVRDRRTPATWSPRERTPAS